jgi:hypothetical protein
MVMAALWSPSTKSKFDDIDGWCVNAGGNTLEFSNFTVSNSVFNLCGVEATNTNVNFTMTAITNANPGRVTTASSHTLISPRACAEALHQLMVGFGRGGFAERLLRWPLP